MTRYNFGQLGRPQQYTERFNQAKAKRQAVLRRVRAQRAVAQKRTVSDWIQAGAVIRGSELKERLEGK